MPAMIPRLSVAVLLAAASGAALAVPTEARFYGYAYDADSNRFLYTEVHHQKLDGSRWLGGTIRYFGPDAKLIATKTLDFSENPYIPVFRMEIPAEQYVEAITSVTDRVLTMMRVSHGKTKMQEVDLTQGMAADSGFHNAIVDRFDAIKSGEPLRFRFGVAGMLDTFSFRARKYGDAMIDGKPAIRLRVEPDSLLRLFGGPIEIAYQTETRHLVDYRGVSNLHNPATGKAYNVHIVYPPAPPADVPQPLPPLD